MSDFDYVRKYQKLKVQKKSGFNKDHRWLGTSKCGTITPILVDELIPNTTVHLESAINACLPPLASEAYANVGLEVCAFAVPMRLLYGGFESWLTGEPILNGDQDVPATIPVLRATSSVTTTTQYIGSSTLSDYLGYKFNVADSASTSSMTATDFNIFPFLAYHKIYDDWFRNSLVDRYCFRRAVNAQGGVLTNQLGTLPYTYISGSTPAPYYLNGTFFDSVHLGDLRQRNFDLDYFCSAQPTAQKGAAQSVTMTVDIPNSATSFTWAAARSAAALQRFAERNNFSNRLVDYVKANYGANLSDGLAQRSLFLGRQYINVYTKGVNQNAPSGSPTSNPFNSVGAQYGRAVITGSGTLVKHFTANEPMILMVLATLVPKVSYSTGIRRMNTRYTSTYSQVDMANAALQTVGNQPIYSYELQPLQATSANPETVFGYTDRYADWMTMNDETHGLLTDGNSLAPFALQRSFTGTTAPTLTSNFLKIPQNYLDQIAAVQGTISGYGTWIDAFFKYRVSMPLAQYSIPSIMDPAYEHGETVKIKKGGASVY